MLLCSWRHQSRLEVDSNFSIAIISRFFCKEKVASLFYFYFTCLQRLRACVELIVKIKDQASRPLNKCIFLFYFFNSSIKKYLFLEFEVCRLIHSARSHSNMSGNKFGNYGTCGRRQLQWTFSVILLVLNTNVVMWCCSCSDGTTRCASHWRRRSQRWRKRRRRWRRRSRPGRQPTEWVSRNSAGAV